MKVGDLVRDTTFHPHWNPDGNNGKRTGVIITTNRFRCEIIWADGGADRFVNKRELEIISESR